MWIDVVRRGCVVLILAAMNFLTECLHQVLLSSLVKHGLAIGIRGKTWRCRHFMSGHRRCVCPSQGHHALDALHVSLILFTLFLLSLTSLSFSSLSRCPSLKFTSDKFQIVGHLDSALEEEQLQVSSFVFKLHLISVLKSFTNGPARTEHCQNLTPVRSLHSIKTGHQSILLLGGPGPPLARET